MLPITGLTVKNIDTVNFNESVKNLPTHVGVPIKDCASGTLLLQWDHTIFLNCTDNYLPELLRQNLS